MARASFAPSLAALLGALAILNGCSMGSPSASSSPPKPDEPVTARESAHGTSQGAAQPIPTGPLLLGAPLGTDAPTVTLAAIAKDPKSFENKVVTTSGTVTAVCQSMGCWMEMKDEKGEAHVKLAGHTFFVPKTSSGHHARVQAKVLRTNPADECAQEAAEQTGKPVAKLELEATGVELD